VVGVARAGLLYRRDYAACKGGTEYGGWSTVREEFVIMNRGLKFEESHLSFACCPMREDSRI